MFIWQCLQLSEMAPEKHKLYNEGCKFCDELGLS